MFFNLEIPEDLEPYIRDYQTKKKNERASGFYALSKCIVAIIREHKAYTEAAQHKDIPPAPGEAGGHS